MRMGELRLHQSDITYAASADRVLFSKHCFCLPNVPMAQLQQPTRARSTTAQIVELMMMMMTALDRLRKVHRDRQTFESSVALRAWPDSCRMTCRFYVAGIL